VVRATSASVVGRWSRAAENAGGQVTRRSRFAEISADHRKRRSWSAEDAERGGRAREPGCRKRGGAPQAREWTRRKCHRWWSVIDPPGEFTTETRTMSWVRFPSPRCGSLAKCADSTRAWHNVPRSGLGRRCLGLGGARLRAPEHTAVGARCSRQSSPVTRFFAPGFPGYHPSSGCHDEVARWG
jgi:hypothetical protein